MSFQLVPLNNGTAPVITLQRPVLLIGRHIDCDVRIENAKISRRHCCLAIAYDRVILRDLGSRNRLRVNGQVVGEVRLQVGDEVAIGPILYRFESEDQKPDVVVAPATRSKPSSGAVGHSPAPDLPMAPASPGWLLDDSDLDLVPLDDI
jgi:pSer/pThr/pTyr-binding forkhead associated (FHA) protein